LGTDSAAETCRVAPWMGIPSRPSLRTNPNALVALVEAPILGYEKSVPPPASWCCDRLLDPKSFGGWLNRRSSKSALFRRNFAKKESDGVKWLEGTNPRTQFVSW